MMLEIFPLVFSSVWEPQIRPGLLLQECPAGEPSSETETEKKSSTSTDGNVSVAPADGGGGGGVSGSKPLAPPPSSSKPLAPPASSSKPLAPPSPLPSDTLPSLSNTAALKAEDPTNTEQLPTASSSSLGPGERGQVRRPTHSPLEGLIGSPRRYGEGESRPSPYLTSSDILRGPRPYQP